MKVKDQTVDPIVRQIVNRDCHVSSPVRSVAKQVVSKLKPGVWEKAPLRQKVILVRQCHAQHEINRLEYCDVMRSRYYPAHW